MIVALVALGLVWFFLVKLRRIEPEAAFNPDAIAAAHNTRLDAEERDYELAIHLCWCDPSVEGNKVIHDTPRTDDESLWMFGFIELAGGRKVFRDTNGYVYRVEVCKPTGIRLRFG